ncbi:MAG: hypothetical protein ACREYD_09905 [Casimicrobiaceae bacterium]
MQRINLPASFANDALLRVDFKGYGLADPAGCPFLAALTVQGNSTATTAIPALSRCRAVALSRCRAGAWLRSSRCWRVSACGR